MICECSKKLGLNGRVLTLDLRLQTLGSEDPKVPKWSNKAQDIALISAKPYRIEISDYIYEIAQNRLSRPNFKF